MKKYLLLGTLLSIFPYHCYANNTSEAISQEAKVTRGHMVGVQKGWTVDYDTILVDFSTKKSQEKSVSPTIWWFYNEDKKNQSISYDRYYDKKFSKFKIDNPEVDAEGNFYLYGKFDYKTGELPTNAKALAELVANGVENLVPMGKAITGIVFSNGKLPSGAAPINTVEFSQWTKSDQPLNVKDIVDGQTQTVTFFNNDLQFDLQF